MPLPPSPPPNNNQANPEAERKPVSGAAAAGNVVACVGVGGLLGWGIDWWLGTLPWGFITGMVLGFIAWLRELWQLLKG